ncbi:hypothetical protein AJ79_05961 [Helicocarpus griseus UAMH5409]|uniref:Uncharacterized protein n=1 Tax=Helicocarpus griseus UAMH5409 TaxID=1447875 RepID=A0A2B7XID7_9EURO|nr:hypothetical protein AJ79_05961 [Helicocarpus griseus UAMH5409]
MVSKRGHGDIVRFLLSTGDVNVSAQSPESNRNSLSLAAEGGFREIVGMLLMEDGHGDPDNRGDKGRAPLTFAIENGNLELIGMIGARLSTINPPVVDVPDEALPSLRRVTTETNVFFAKKGLTGNNWEVYLTPLNTPPKVFF